MSASFFRAGELVLTLISVRDCLKSTKTTARSHAKVSFTTSAYVSPVLTFI